MDNLKLVIKMHESLMQNSKQFDYKIALKLIFHFKWVSIERSSLPLCSKFFFDKTLSPPTEKKKREWAESKGMNLSYVQKSKQKNLNKITAVFLLINWLYNAWNLAEKNDKKIFSLKYLSNLIAVLFILLSSALSFSASSSSQSQCFHNNS